jgi:BMFP domain-containing protein YqiC
MNDDDAMRLFERKGFEDAFSQVQDKNPALRSREFKQIAKTIKFLKLFSRKELVKTVNDPARREMLRKLREEVDSLLKDITSLESAKGE